MDEAGAGAAGAAAGKPVWRRLGFLNFDPNERSQFTARELKSVSLTGTTARFVRLVFHKCHANPANLYSQARAGWCCEMLHGGHVQLAAAVGCRAVVVCSWMLQWDAVPRLFKRPWACFIPAFSSWCAVCLLNSAARSLQVSLVALSLTGDLLVPSPLAPITNTAPFGVPGGAPPTASPPPMAYMQPPQLQQQFGAMSLGPAPPPPPQQQQQSAAEAAAALAAELGVDTVTAQRIYELQQQKQQV